MANAKPSGPDWEAWRAAEEAHWEKHGKGSGTYFEWEGERWKLDNKATKGQPRKFSPKSVDKKNTENKKVGGHREKMLEAQTAPDVDPKEAQAARARINAKGNEHHHINARSRVEKGIQAKYGGVIPDDVRQQFADVDQYFGDDPRNFADLTIPEHRTGPNAVHKVEKYMDDSIKKAGSQADEIFGMLRNAVRNKTFRRVVRSVAPIVPIVGQGMGAANAAEYTMRAAETGDPLDATQASLATAGLTPGVGIVADVANTAIDLYRAGGSHNRIRGRSGAQKAQQGR